MILLLHVVIATLSLGISIYSFFQPSEGKLTAALSLFIGTISTGLLVALTQPVKLGHLCASGLVFSAITAGLYVKSQRKLAAERINTDN